MPLPLDQYANYVRHPRYGRRPRITGLNPDPLADDVRLHWNATSLREIAQRFERLMGKPWPRGMLHGSDRGSQRIPNTAIAADLARQSPATVQVTHYFDIDRVCGDCRRPFIFFAAEQKHWYEELGFGLESDCVRCVPCRKREQGFARLRQRYEELFHLRQKTDSQNLEMAECSLTLLEAGAFNRKQIPHIRGLLKKVGKSADPSIKSRASELLARASLPDGQ